MATAEAGLLLRFIAARDDGLCMRLLALLNAQRLAAAFGGTPGLEWTEQVFAQQDKHTASDPKLIFAPGYLARCRVAQEDLPPAAPVLEAGPLKADGFGAVLAQARRCGAMRIGRPQDITSLAATQAGAGPIPDAADLFDAIEFAPAVRTAIAAARAMPLASGAVALHIRGGDIVHGSNSNSGAYTHKAVSVFEAEALVDLVRTRGQTLYLIGQEEDLIAHLTDRHDHVRAMPLCDPALGPVAAVFHDVIMFSRMALVYGGNSGVTRLAAQIGTMQWLDVMRLDLGIDPRLHCDDPLAGPDYAGLSANLRALSYYKLFYLFDAADWTQAHLTLARLMVAHRPRWQYGRLVLACLLARFGHFDAAEAECVQVLEDGPHEGWPDVIAEYVLAEQDPFPRDQIACLADADRVRHPAAARLYRMVFQNETGA